MNCEYNNSQFQNSNFYNYVKIQITDFLVCNYEKLWKIIEFFSDILVVVNPENFGSIKNQRNNFYKYDYLLFIKNVETNVILPNKFHFCDFVLLEYFQRVNPTLL